MERCTEKAGEGISNRKPVTQVFSGIGKSHGKPLGAGRVHDKALHDMSAAHQQEHSLRNPLPKNFIALLGRM
jgi:hypothetical protein